MPVIYCKERVRLGVVTLAIKIQLDGMRILHGCGKVVRKGRYARRMESEAACRAMRGGRRAEGKERRLTYSPSLHLRDRVMELGIAALLRLL